jgi:hypothetical protein
MAQIRPDFGSATLVPVRTKGPSLQKIRLSESQCSGSPDIWYGSRSADPYSNHPLSLYIRIKPCPTKPLSGRSTMVRRSLYDEKDTCVFDKVLTSGCNFQDEFQSVNGLDDQEVPQLQPLSCLKDQLPPLSCLKNQLPPLGSHSVDQLPHLSCLKDQLPPLSSHSVDQFITSTSPTPEMSFFYSGVQQGPFLRFFFF